jgi:hypothetical protein
MLDRQGVILADDRPVFVALFSPIGLNPEDFSQVRERLSAIVGVAPEDLDRRPDDGEPSEEREHRIEDQIEKDLVGHLTRVLSFFSLCEFVLNHALQFHELVFRKFVPVLDERQDGFQFLVLEKGGFDAGKKIFSRLFPARPDRVNKLSPVFLPLREPFLVEARQNGHDGRVGQIISAGFEFGLNGRHRTRRVGFENSDNIHFKGSEIVCFGAHEIQNTTSVVVVNPSIFGPGVLYLLHPYERHT